MEMMQPIPTRAQIKRAWLKHAHSFDRCEPPLALVISSSPPIKQRLHEADFWKICFFSLQVYKEAKISQWKTSKDLGKGKDI